MISLFFRWKDQCEDNPLIVCALTSFCDFWRIYHSSQIAWILGSPGHTRLLESCRYPHSLILIKKSGAEFGFRIARIIHVPIQCTCSMNSFCTLCSVLHALETLCNPSFLLCRSLMPEILVGNGYIDLIMTGSQYVAWHGQVLDLRQRCGYTQSATWFNPFFLSPSLGKRVDSIVEAVVDGVLCLVGTSRSIFRWT